MYTYVPQIESNNNIGNHGNLVQTRYVRIREIAVFLYRRHARGSKTLHFYNADALHAIGSEEMRQMEDCFVTLFIRT